MKIKKEYLPDLARICADITGDGHLQIKNWRHLTSFYCNDKKQIIKIKKRFKIIFGLEGKIYTRKNNNFQYRFFINSKPVAEFLNKKGVPKGKKTETNFLVPHWIYSGNIELKRNYLRGLFACEGCIYSTKQKNGKIRWRICISMYKSESHLNNGKEFMQQIKDMVSKFNIVTSPVHFGNTSLRKNGTRTRGFKFEIEGHQFEKFYKQIGFDETSKSKKLREAIAGMRRAAMRRYSKKNSRAKRPKMN